MQIRPALAIAALIASTLACNLPGAGAAKTALEAGTPLARPRASETNTAIPPEPTQTEILPTETLEPSPTDAPTQFPPSPTPGVFPYSEKFDINADNWSDALVVTTQASGRDPYLRVAIDGGTLNFAIQDKETYVYKFFDHDVSGTAKIAVTYENHGVPSYGISLVCEANPARTAWYEVRLDDGKYAFYHYDTTFRTTKKNPYLKLGQGSLTAKELPLARGTTFSLTCSQHQLQLDLGEGKKVVTLDVEDRLEGNGVGLAVMAYDTLPASISFSAITVESNSQP